MEKTRILVVEDEKNIARTIEATFNNAAYYLEICYDGESALAKLQAEKWDIAFLDIKLPGINGMDVLRQISEQKNPVQVIMITAYGSIEFAVQAMKYGAVDFIQKPFEPEALRSIVTLITERHSIKENEIEEYQGFIELFKKQVQERDYHKAHDTIKKAIEIKPESAEAYNYLGIVIEMLGDIVAAVQAYQMALKFDKDYKPALGNIKRVTSMESNTIGLMDLMGSRKSE